jgi:hypothetical protein
MIYIRAAQFEKKHIKKGHTEKIKKRTNKKTKREQLAKEEIYSNNNNIKNILYLLIGIINMIYTMEHYNSIVYSNFTYKLPEVELNIINNLIKELGISIANQESITDDKYKYKRTQSNKKYSNKCEDSWEKTKPFVATKIEKKEGLDKIVNDIRICLNKMSNKNYEAQRDLINQSIIEINATDETNENVKRIIKDLFETATSNKFYSEMYAMLYKELLEQYEYIDVILEEFILEYTEGILLIEYVDSNTDYDKYCDNNKMNDKRKGMAMFIVNLMKKNIINFDKLLHIINYLQGLILKYIDEDNKTFAVEEITENLFLLVTSSVSVLKNESGWKTVVENITNVSQLKVKDHKSLSSRAIFKNMDIIDNLRNI